MVRRVKGSSIAAGPVEQRSQHPVTYEKVREIAEHISNSGPSTLRRIIRDTPELLSTCSDTGHTVAHSLAAMATVEMKEEMLRHESILRLATKEGYTVAHQLARSGPDRVRASLIETCSSQILLLSTYRGKWSVALELASTYSQDILLKLAAKGAVLRVPDSSGRTVSGVIERRGSKEAKDVAERTMLYFAFSKQHNGRRAKKLIPAPPPAAAHLRRDEEQPELFAVA